ncbi:hypothetical protein P7D98_19395 [Enterococcus avium]|uniref:hypothetical protein n=1 Tax=Enterococcus avium TaxID=33945 RepID=UPI00288EA547|nr:hypothetical protein [Enterococcus avium]MDT2438006.1 hypothetical protein [Enterococcus avium]MDT2467846.1 hypothetical protein [Enterococcus avium]MDT2507238.1 hypothetical protein [Enterococcus avium]
MKLIDYIREGYNVVTSQRLGRMIRDVYPGVLVFTDRAFDGIPHGKLLVDAFYSGHPAVLYAKSYQDSFVVERFTNDFVGAEMVLPLTGEAGVRSMKLLEQSLKYLNNKQEPNLLEIKLKDTDSVPEVYYKGEKIEGLFDIAYHYRTTTDRVDGSANDINIEYFDKVDKFPDKKIIGHKREV